MAEISLRRARTIIRKTLDHGKAAGMKPLSVIVLDSGGNPIAFERSDGASPGRYQIAHGKAYGAVGMGRSTRMLSGLAEERPQFAAALVGVSDGRFVPVPGGVLIKDGDGEIIGSVGVSGDTSDNDEAAGAAGIEAAGLVPGI